MTLVRIYTDAGIVAGTGTWAAIILREGHDMVELCGELRGHFQSSTAVELCAAANAIHAAGRRHLFKHGDRVELRSDNQTTVDRANGSYVNRPKTDRRLIDATRVIRDLRKTHNVELVALHVKGHQRLDSLDPHAIYNLRCDHLARAVREGTTPPAFADFAAKVARAQARRANGNGSKRELALWKRDRAASPHAVEGGA